MAEINSYSELVDAIWMIVQGTPEERERIDFAFSEQQIAGRLGISWAFDSDPCVFGIAQSLNDLVDLGYCRGRGSFNGHRWMHVSPSVDCPDELPSTQFMRLPLIRLSSLRAGVLQFIHEQTLRHEEGITFYVPEMSLPHEEAVNVFLPMTTEVERFTARGTVIQALTDLNDHGFVSGSITVGYSTLWPTLKGSCWLLMAQPLLKLEERASRLSAYPESLEATRLLANAYSEQQHSAAGSLYIVIEKLENAVGGERGLTNFLNQPRAYISDLKQSVQQYRHAATQARANLNYQQCLKRATEIVEQYITFREQGSN